MRPAAAAVGMGKKQPQTFLKAVGRTPTLEDVAELIKEGKVKNVVIMAGAGISTSAGIPDFRSPETGLYSNLEKYELPYPEAIFDIDYFVKQPQAFFALAKELYPGNFKPTHTHYFFKLLQKKGILRTVFTQNIDTLERIAGLDEESVIEAHGSFAEAECLECKYQYTKEEIRPQIDRGEVVWCTQPSCKGRSGALVKPKIVFFGEGLPERFFHRLPDFHICDLLIVLGTSLSVQPFASLIHRVPLSCPRLLMNLEAVGEASRTSTFSSSPSDELEEGFDFDGHTGRPRGIRDVLWKGPSDEGVKSLCRALEWEEQLEDIYVRERALLDLQSGKAPETESEEEAEVERKREAIIDAVAEAEVIELDEERREREEEREEEELEALTRAVVALELEAEVELEVAIDASPALASDLAPSDAPKAVL